MKLGFLRCAVSVSEDYRPYRHKSRTLFFNTPGRWQSKTLILSTYADQNSIETGVSIVIVNTVSCDYYPRSSIVKSVFNCRLPGMFNLNTAPALCIYYMFRFQIMSKQLQRREL